MSSTVSQDLRPRASSKSLRKFELASLIFWVMTAVLIATVGDSQRDYWFLFLSWTLMFPLCVVADEHAFVVRYDSGFLNLAPGIPAMVPFAFGWFFTLPAVLVGSLQGIAQVAMHERFLILFAILVARSFFTEWLGVKQSLWSYPWSPPSPRWKGVPVLIPFVDAIACVLLVALHGYTARVTHNMGWNEAFATSYLVYAGAFAAFALSTGLVIRRALGVRAI
jgi:hypothetical protein